MTGLLQKRKNANFFVTYLPIQLLDVASSLFPLAQTKTFAKPQPIQAQEKESGKLATTPSLRTKRNVGDKPAGLNNKSPAHLKSRSLLRCISVATGLSQLAQTKTSVQLQHIPVEG